MAVGRIKGITIELGGDSTKLEACLKNVNQEIRTTESKLKDVNKLLKMDPGNTNLLSQKYKTLQTEIKATKEKLDTLKEAAKQADQALADGKMSQDQYDALQREIAETEQDLKSLEQEYASLLARKVFKLHKEETIQANIKFVKSCSKDSDIWTAVTIATQMSPIKATKYARMSTISWDIEG